MGAKTYRSMLTAAAAITAAKGLCEGCLRFLGQIQQTRVALEWREPGCSIGPSLCCLRLDNRLVTEAILEVGSGLWRSTLEVWRRV